MHCAFNAKQQIGNLKFPPESLMIILRFDLQFAHPFPNFYRRSESSKFGLWGWGFEAKQRIKIWHLRWMHLWLIHLLSKF